MTQEEKIARERLEDLGYEIHENKENPLGRDVYLPDGPLMGALSLTGLKHFAELERVKMLFDDLQAMLRRIGNAIRQAEQIG